ncbi:sulfurtransferase complex subunit TusB [Duffyella gerundensis]|uniref:sulfurtransferase complex subunit TusB n=1 Tax=Duffyella TaxID=3026546 RepID=UPI003F6E0A4A
MLFTLMRSPYQIDLDILLQALTAEDALLLLQDGVTAAVEKSRFLPRLTACSAQLYVLQEDVAARGLVAQISTNFAVIDYNGFVTLTIKHQQQVAW